MDSLIEITDGATYYDQISAVENAIVMFSADWCPDCLFVKHFIKDLVAQNKKYTWFYVDRDKLLDICIDNEILGIPSFIAYNNGNQIGTFISKDRKNQAQIQEFIDKLEG